MELKPCPFCGDTNIEIASENGDFWYAFCNRCLCEGPNVLSIKDAIYEWNDRAGDAFETTKRDELAASAPIYFNTIKEHYKDDFSFSELIKLLIKFKYEYADNMLEAMKNELCKG